MSNNLPQDRKAAREFREQFEGWPHAQGCEAVYIVSDGEFVKIGTSENAQRRIGVLNGASPRNLSVLAIIPGGLSKESELHDRFYDLRVKGEWFRMGPEIDAFVEECRGRYFDLKWKYKALKAVWAQRDAKRREQ